MNSIPCDIVLLPEESLADRAIALSEELEQYATLYTLKYGAYYPHSTLYMTQLKVSDLDKVSSILGSIAESVTPFDLTANRYDQGSGSVVVEYLQPPPLADLQWTVIEAINPIRDGMRAKDRVRLEVASGRERENLEQFGFISVGELFVPHLTITRFSDKQPINETLLPRVDQFSGRFIKLGLFEMGDNGTCIREIAEFRLGDAL